jgi:hypothetical protein
MKDISAERTDLISTVPKRVGVHAAENLAIEIYEVPLPLPQPEFALYWHERSRDDLGHRWTAAASISRPSFARFRNLLRSATTAPRNPAFARD